MADETKPVVSEVKVEDVDWEAKYNETNETLAKVAAERENYKRVALSKKGKDDNETEDEKIARIVAQQLQESTEARLLREKDEIAKKALQENKELKVALKNRAQVGTSASTGGGQSTTDVKTDFWTAEQLAYFKKRNIDPEKAKENYLKLQNK